MRIISYSLNLIFVMLVKLDYEPYCKGRRAYSVSGSPFVDTDLTYRSKVVSLRCHSLIMNENLSDGMTYTYKYCRHYK
jgi:ferredoxin-NADP reductase